VGWKQTRDVHGPKIFGPAQHGPHIPGHFAARPDPARGQLRHGLPRPGPQAARPVLISKTDFAVLSKVSLFSDRNVVIYLTHESLLRSKRSTKNTTCLLHVRLEFVDDRGAVVFAVV